MPRNKAARITRINDPAKVQDHTGFADRLTETLIEDFFAPLSERITLLEGQLTGAAVQVGDMQVTEVELPYMQTGGTVYIEPAGGFDPTTLGRPVMVQQAASDDDSDEGGIVLFTGDVGSTTQMRVRWYAPFGAPTRVKVVYLIG